MKNVAGQALRFSAVGLLNTVVGLGAIWSAMWLGTSPILSNAIGYAVGLMVSFAFNRNWTFRRDFERDAVDSTAPEMVRFIFAFLAAWLINIAVVSSGLQWTDISPYVLQIAGMGTYTVTFFVICKVWVFRS